MSMPKSAICLSTRLGSDPGELLRQLAVTGVTNVIRLHNNEEPWEPLPDPLEAISRAAHDLNRYPDHTYRELTRALSDLYRVDERPLESYAGVGNDSMLASSHVHGELTNRRQPERTEVRQEQWG